jgi:predicted acylesterase/phospholipase RssA
VRWDTEEDFARITRFLRGRAVGLVLGGGGARGISHFGVLRALVESGIPIDMVGGTSVGGVLATRYAMGGEAAEMERDGREVFVRRNPFRELTLPIVSLIGSKRLRHLAKEVYGDARIEDLWLNCFCISCDISTGETVVLRNGLVWKAALATSALPGISAPVVDGNRLLVDGGVVDSLPASTMKEFCGGNMILVDVGSERDLSPSDDRMPSAAEIVFSRLLPHRKPVHAPTIAQVIARTTTISSVRRREEAHRLAMLLLRPPVDQFGLLEFASFDDIVNVGYHYTMEAIALWRGDDRR